MAHKKEAKKFFLDHDGEVSIKVLARKGKVSQKEAKAWISEWAYLLEDDELSEETEELLGSGVKDFGLKEQEELFCFHYVKSYNATQAALKAGYSPSYAHARGYTLLNKANVRDFIDKLRTARNKELFVEGMDIVEELMKMAFSDITDYVEFGTRKQRIYSDDGSFSDTDRSFVKLKDSLNVDGSIIQEVKVGRDGVSLKLYDKQRALAELNRFINQEDKLKVKLMQAQIDKLEKDDGTSTEDLLGKYLDLLGAEVDAH